MSIPELIEQLQELASLPEAKNMKVQFTTMFKIR